MHETPTCSTLLLHIPNYSPALVRPKDPRRRSTTSPLMSSSSIAGAEGGGGRWHTTDDLKALESIIDTPIGSSHPADISSARIGTAPRRNFSPLQ
ncbi:hypothetical protein CC2G_006757 [Coprinopsis cinerea AmutBmut pab1-1]|nr:hypothetical protein CC2G_006757 [Coprinopsis cinerea AmutBmut pab1-1]